jgi:hypothetical protein
MAAAARLGKEDPEPLAIGPGAPGTRGDETENDAAFAIGAGALVASHWIAQTGGGFTETERRDILQVLAPAASSAAAKEVRALLV